MEQHVEANPSNGSPEAYLDGLRGLALIAVVVIHSWGWAGHPSFAILGRSVDFVIARFGWGVDLFFLLSGFLLARPWFVAEITGAPNPSLRKYFRRRAGRLIPGYYVSLAVLLVLFVPLHVVPTGSVTGSVGFWNIAGHLSFLHHALPITGSDFNGVNGVYWTLTVEFLFYLCLPWAVRLFRGRNVIVVPLVCLVASELWLYLSLHSMGGLIRLMVDSVQGRTGSLVGVPAAESYMRQTFLINQFPTWLFAFSIGIAMARLVVRHRAGLVQSRWLTDRVAVTCVAVGVVGMVAVSYELTRSVDLHPTSTTWPYLLSHSPYDVFLAMILFGLTFGPAWTRRPVETLPMRYLGWVSYGVYLYHLLVLYCLFHLTSLGDLAPLPRFYAAVGLTWLIVLPIATVSWMAIERPFLQRHRAVAAARTRWRRRSVGVGAAAALLIVGGTLGASATDVSKRPVETPLGPVSFASVTPQFTGRTTVLAAAAHGVIYPREQQFLSACGAIRGQTVGLGASKWGMTGSVFTCRDATAATELLEVLPVWEDALKFDVVPSGIGGVQLYRWVAPEATSADPYRFHVRYRSGATVIGVAISATSDSAGRKAVRTILSSATARYQATP